MRTFIERGANAGLATVPPAAPAADASQHPAAQHPAAPLAAVLARLGWQVGGEPGRAEPLRLTVAVERRVARLCERLRGLRNQESATSAALAEADRELASRSHRQWLHRLYEESPRLAERAAAERCRADVENLERELVLVRGAVGDCVEELAHLFAAARGGRVTQFPGPQSSAPDARRHA